MNGYNVDTATWLTDVLVGIGILGISPCTSASPSRAALMSILTIPLLKSTVALCSFGHEVADNQGIGFLRFRFILA
jgi:hypothetical protein